MDPIRDRYPAEFFIPEGHMRLAMVRYSDGGTGVGILKSDEVLNQKEEPVLSIIFASPTQARMLAHVLTSIANRMEGRDPHDQA